MAYRNNPKNKFENLACFFTEPYGCIIFLVAQKQNFSLFAFKIVLFQHRTEQYFSSPAFLLSNGGK